MTRATHPSGLVVVNGASLFVEEAGAGSAVVLIHAGIADSRMREPQFDVLAAHHRVIRYDVRGFGRSLMPPGTYSHREDLRSLLTHLECSTAHIVGCSMGGRIAIDFAIDYPSVPASLILVGTGLGGYSMSPHLDDIEEQIEKCVAAGDFEAAAAYDVRTWVEGPRRSPDRVDAGLRAAAK